MIKLTKIMNIVDISGQLSIIEEPLFIRPNSIRGVPMENLNVRTPHERKCTIIFIEGGFMEYVKETPEEVLNKLGQRNAYCD